MDLTHPFPFMHRAHQRLQVAGDRESRFAGLEAASLTRSSLSIGRDRSRWIDRKIPPRLTGGKACAIARSRQWCWSYEMRESAFVIT